MANPLTSPTSASPTPIGSGAQLPHSILALATLFALSATLLSLYTILLHLQNYRRPLLQRYTVRILFMYVPNPPPPHLRLPLPREEETDESGKGTHLCDRQYDQFVLA